MLKIFILFTLIITLAQSQTPLNICGGTRHLQNIQIGEICDAGEFADCSFGTTTCSPDLNSIVCIPNCSVTIRMVLEKNDTFVVPRCENNGYWDFFTESCVCPIPYSGGLCQFKDECYNIDCNNQGTCSQGVCICHPDFIGPFCETHVKCRSFNLIWTGSSCQCAFGWTGMNCDRCLNTSICVPNKNMIGYTLLNIQNEYLLQTLLNTPPPPNWNDMQPYKPTPDNFQCQCTSFNSFFVSSLIEGIVDISSINSKSNPTIVNSYELNPYIEEFVEHHHQFHHVSKHKNNSYPYYLIGIVIFLFIIFGIIYYSYFEKKESTLKRKRRKHSPPTH